MQAGDWACFFSDISKPRADQACGFLQGMLSASADPKYWSGSE